ncbi:hypothetical protein AVEN_1735-1 [Araneus ventricosus]|uniref:Uncharacterized protein n=1 Tax=Araneus ventricosus TaxID=182803 RepID=A0A4Y2ICF1_ARAVE|nr:hypothetical protein AVEN_1735-1 [Araneus ventricosus]
MTRTVPELATPSPNFRTTSAEPVRVPDKTTVLKTRADNSEEQILQRKHTGEMSGITFDKAKFNVGLRDNVINMLGKIESSVKSNTKVSN